MKLYESAGRSLLFIATLLTVLWLQYVPIKVHSSSYPSAAALVQIAKQKYDLGQFDNSVTALETAAEIYHANRQLREEARTQSLLSLVHEKLGHWQQAERAIALSLSLSKKLQKEDRTSLENILLRAQVLNRQGRWLLATGDAEAALNTAKEAEQLYTRTQDSTGVIGSKINQAQALEVLGYYRQVRQTQQELTQQTAFLPDTDPEIRVSALHSLGNFWRQEGELNRSQISLTKALKLAREQHLPEFESKILLSLGNTERLLAKNAQFESKQYLQQTLNYYRRACVLAITPLTKIQAQLNELSFLIQTNKTENAKKLLKPIAKKLENLPKGRSAIFARINLAQSVLSLQEDLFSQTVERYLVDNLNQAIAVAREIKDNQAESYALGTLGKYYEQKIDWQNAKELTISALSLAQQLNIPELTYQWQWQMGRITQAESEKSDNSEAIAYYDLALDTLQNLRRDLAASNPELQFSFQESVEPVYRQYIDLLLASSPISQDNLIESIQVLEELQVAELDNLFRDACARAKVSDVGNLDESAAIVYPILLPDRLEVILKLPGDDRFYHHTQSNVSQRKINAAVEQIQPSLVRRSTSPNQIKLETAQFYNWLIEPFVKQLETDLPRQKSKIKTLVFVLDGALRNLPMSVLHDGQKYLVERYAVAVSPGIQLTEPQISSRADLNVLLAGADNAPSFQALGLAPLENVPLELAGIAQTVKQTDKLEDRQFQQANLQQKINDDLFNIVHIATHGQFGSSSQETYILDWNESIGLKDLDRILEAEDPKKAKAIDLLVLSACETATGDRQAALGLAGVAVRSGASSTIASLWQVNDASTAQFMIEFYRQLSNSQLSKAEALRNAQLKFLTYEDDSDYYRPYHWASFILVGDWR